MDRRTFLSRASLLGGALVFANNMGTAGVSKNSRVVQAQRSDVRTAAKKISGDAVQKLLDAAIENYFQRSRGWHGLNACKNMTWLA